MRPAIETIRSGISPAAGSKMSTDHRKLDAFNLADEFVASVYGATRDFPTDERYGLRSQIRRAAVGVPPNIVEGCGRDSDRERARFLEIAFSSAREAIYLIDLAGRLGLIDRASELARFRGRISAALASLRRSLLRPP